MLGPSFCVKESEDGGYGSLNAESSFETTCSRNIESNTRYNKTTFRPPARNGERPAYLGFFEPLCQVLLCGWVWSLGRSSIDSVVQTVGFLSGAASSIGRHIGTWHWADGAAGWRRSSLPLNRWLCRMREGTRMRTGLLNQKLKYIYTSLLWKTTVKSLLKWTHLSQLQGWTCPGH